MSFIISANIQRVKIKISFCWTKPVPQPKSPQAPSDFAIIFSVGYNSPASGLCKIAPDIQVVELNFPTHTKRKQIMF